MNLSILITAHNESYREVQDTLASIRETAGDRVEIVVVDDATQVPLALEDKQAKLIRLNNRAGVGPARHIAALNASGDWLLITDAHVRFEKGWLEKLENRLSKAEPSTVLCGSCVALRVGMMDMAKAQTVYTGATLSMFGDAPNNMDVLEGKWLSPRDDDDFPMACPMGASYVLNADWFAHIHGLNMLRSWYGDEPLLGIKTWLAGGEICAFKGLRIGHQFRDASPYRTANWHLLWNKMAIAYSCFLEPQADKIMRQLQGSAELQEAKRHFYDDYGFIMAERAYLQSIFTRDLEWYCQFFGIRFPE